MTGRNDIGLLLDLPVLSPLLDGRYPGNVQCIREPAYFISCVKQEYKRIFNKRQNKLHKITEDATNP